MSIGSPVPVRLLVVSGLLLAAAPTMRSASRSSGRPARWYCARTERHTIRVDTGTPGAAGFAFVFEAASPRRTSIVVRLPLW